MCIEGKPTLFLSVQIALSGPFRVLRESGIIGIFLKWALLSLLSVSEGTGFRHFHWPKSLEVLSKRRFFLIKNKKYEKKQDKASNKNEASTTGSPEYLPLVVGQCSNQTKTFPIANRQPAISYAAPHKHVMYALLKDKRTTAGNKIRDTNNGAKKGHDVRLGIPFSVRYAPLVCCDNDAVTSFTPVLIKVY